MPEDKEKIIIEVDESDSAQQQEQKPTVRVLAFLLGGEDYCIDIEQAKEVIRLPQITRVPNVPVIMLTARAAMKDTFEAFDADEFIPKPLDSEKLISKIKLVLTNRVLLLNEDDFVSQKVIKVFKKLGYETEIIKDQESMLRQLEQNKYKVVVVHLSLISKEPEDFIFSVKIGRNKEAKLIIYSDAKVKGTEDGSTVAIDELRKKWKTAGLEMFFDSRIAKDTFEEALKRWLG